MSTPSTDSSKPAAAAKARATSATDRAGSPSSSSSSESASGAGSSKSALLGDVTTLQFAWFVGHLVTVVATLLYVLTYVRVFPRAYKVWYKLALLGAIESFGVLIFQTVKKNGLNAKALLKDDNVQYIALAVVLFVASPYVLLTLSAFGLFSALHVLSYSRNYILPSLGIPETHPFSVQIGKFVTANNKNSISLAALLEVYTALWLFVRVLLLRRRSIVPFVAYAIFLKLRYENSVFTKSAFKSVELKLEGLVNQTGNPAAKNAWVQVKGVFHKIGGTSITAGQPRDKSI